MRYEDIMKEIEKEAPIERVKQWHDGETIYVLVRCFDTKKFNAMCEKFNGIVPDGRKDTECIGICRRA